MMDEDPPEFPFLPHNPMTLVLLLAHVLIFGGCTGMAMYAGSAWVLLMLVPSALGSLHESSKMISEWKRKVARYHGEPDE